MSIKTINALTLLTPSTVDVENDSIALGDASASDNARMAFANVAGMIPFAVCDSAAASQAKNISLPGLVISDAVAVEVCVQFTHENTAGTITSGTNVVSDDTAPYFIINNDTTKHYKITVAGENAGSGFNKAGERQKFIIYGGTADSETAANVYSVSDTYSKQRDGSIEQNVTIVNVTSNHETLVSVPLTLSICKYITMYCIPITTFDYKMGYYFQSPDKVNIIVSVGSKNVYVLSIFGK